MLESREVVASTIKLRILRATVKSAGVESGPQRIATDETRTACPSLAKTNSSAVAHAPVLRPLQLREATRYNVIGEHGRGGLGRVVRAHDTELGRDIAIKELLSRSYASELRFFREALITARLEHPSIVPVHEAGRWADGTPFYAMKLVSGRSLKELIANATTSAKRDALLPHVMAVADALAYAHTRNTIHRDLKPANVIVGNFGETVVIDWGLAKVLGEDDDVTDTPYRTSERTELTVVGTVLGTPAYMAPEQQRGEHVDQRVDVYAIGAMLWELCIGGALAAVPIEERAVALRRAKLDKDLATIISKAIAQRPELRYRDASDLAADLRAYETGARIAARNYTLPAILAHWTRRHRTVALSVASLLVFAIAGSIVYVRNIRKERERTAAALVESNAQRAAANAERDRAQISEVTALLDKDPTRARDLLRSIPLHTPQHALLLSRSSARAASHVVQLKDRLENLAIGGSAREVVAVTTKGDLFVVDQASGHLEPRDRNVLGQLVRRNEQWIYVRSSHTSGVTVTSMGGAPSIHLDPGSVIKTPSSGLSVADNQLFVVEPTGDMYRLDETGPTLLEHHVRSVAGNDHIFMRCTVDGRLIIRRSGAVVEDTACLSEEGSALMDAAGDHFVAVRDPRTLVSDRGSIALPGRISGEYAAAVSELGVIVVANFGGEGAWYVRPDSLRAEPMPSRGSRPSSVAVDGNLAAFGYLDGVVVVIDISSGESWVLAGHSGATAHVVIDASHRRVITSALTELRIWELPTNPIRVQSQLPCSPFNIIALTGSTELAFDCSDGGVRIWQPTTGAIRELHRHHDLSFGLVEYGTQVCSGGWDGRVLCTPRGGGETRELLNGGGEVKWLTSCEDKLIIATANGTVSQYDGQLRALFAHHDSPYRIAVDDECHHVASGAVDGSLIVYDLVRGREVESLPNAHGGQITKVFFRGHDLETASTDATVKRWKLHDNSIELSETVAEAGSVHRFQPLQDGWAVGARETFAVHSTDSSRLLRLELGHPIASLTTSRDQRYIAFSDHSEIVVIDRERNALTSVFSSSSDELDCLRFISANTLATCGNASLAIVSIDSLSFVNYVP